MNFNWSTKNWQIDRGYLTALSSNTDTAYYGNTKFWKYFIIYPNDSVTPQFCFVNYATIRSVAKWSFCWFCCCVLDGEYSNNRDVTSSPSMTLNRHKHLIQLQGFQQSFKPFHVNSITLNESLATLHNNKIIGFFETLFQFCERFS